MPERFLHYLASLICRNSPKSCVVALQLREDDFKSYVHCYTSWCQKFIDLLSYNRKLVFLDGTFGRMPYLRLRSRIYLFLRLGLLFATRTFAGSRFGLEELRSVSGGCCVGKVVES